MIRVWSVTGLFFFSPFAFLSNELLASGRNSSNSSINPFYTITNHRFSICKGYQLFLLDIPVLLWIDDGVSFCTQMITKNINWVTSWETQRVVFLDLTAPYSSCLAYDLPQAVTLKFRYTRVPLLEWKNVKRMCFSSVPLLPWIQKDTETGVGA